VRTKGEKQIPFGNDNKKSKGKRGGAKVRASGPRESRLAVEPQRLIALDWSGRVDAAGQRRHIWAGVWTLRDDGRETVGLQNGRTREEVVEWLIELAQETPWLVVSIDCCFSYPAWFLREHGSATVFDFWRSATEGQADKWLSRECADERFWGKPGLHHAGKRPAQFCGEGLRSMYRHTDYDNKFAQALEGGDPERAAKMKGITPKSPFQIGGSGSVGTGSLRAMPVLLRLHDAGFRIWPFESAGLRGAKPKPLLVEMYTRLMTGAVAKSNAAARKAYLKLKCRDDAVYAPVGRAVIRKAQGSEDAFDALVSTMEMVRHRNAFANLRATNDEESLLEGITWRPGVSA
jgi:hypothetical protein